MYRKTAMNKKEIKEFIKSAMNDNVSVTDITDEFENQSYKSVYLGTYMSLDPCGKFHHVLSPNEITKRCEQFWNSMEKVAEELGGIIHESEGDGCDVIFSWNFKDSINKNDTTTK